MDKRELGKLVYDFNIAVSNIKGRLPVTDYKDNVLEVHYSTLEKVGKFLVDLLTEMNQQESLKK